jgi:hypothetical protein
MGLSLLSVVFRVSLTRNESTRNKKPPAMQVEAKEFYKESPFRYNRGAQATNVGRKGDYGEQNV